MHHFEYEMWMEMLITFLCKQNEDKIFLFFCNDYSQDYRLRACQSEIKMFAIMRDAVFFFFLSFIHSVSHSS